MSINLSKGQKINLKKENGGELKKVVVGLGWDEAPQKGLLGGLFGKQEQTIDCDASAFLCTGGRVISSDDIIYFGNLMHSTGAVQHMGDNTTGAGEGDDEQIIVNLNQLPQSYDKIAFVVNIYQAASKKQEFGMIKNAFIRIVDADTNQELCRYNLTESYKGMTAMIFGEIYRYNGDWKFTAIGQGTTDTDIKSLARRFS